MRILLFLLLFLFPQVVWSTSLTLDEVMTSTMKHFPKILQANYKVEEAQEKVTESLGNFDFLASAKGDARTRGFYSGRSIDFQLEKPLGILSSTLYTGYRVSDGRYPDYEGKYVTLEDGEYRLGIEFSLLQNRDIDLQRLNLKQSELLFGQSQFHRLQARYEVRKKATKAYWSWVAKGKIVEMYQQMLDISLNRDVAIKKRVKGGDLAKIYIDENKQYILKRRQLLVMAKNEFQNAALKLSLYYRDDRGEPRLPTEEQIPPAFEELPDHLERSEKLELLDAALAASPAIQSLQYEIDRLYNIEVMAENKLMPKLDLILETNRDSGNGSKTRVGQENRIGLKFEFPLERRAAYGKRSQARAKSMRVQKKLQLSRESLKVETTQIFNLMNASLRSLHLSKNEIELAQKLRKAEQVKFLNGASDFFILNLREQNLLDAELKNIKSYLIYHYALADFEQLTLDPKWVIPNP